MVLVGRLDHPDGVRRSGSGERTRARAAARRAPSWPPGSPGRRRNAPSSTAQRPAHGARPPRPSSRPAAPAEPHPAHDVEVRQVAGEREELQLEPQPDAVADRIRAGGDAALEEVEEPHEPVEHPRVRLGLGEELEHGLRADLGDRQGVRRSRAPPRARRRCRRPTRCAARPCPRAGGAAPESAAPAARRTATSSCEPPSRSRSRARARRCRRAGRGRPRRSAASAARSRRPCTCVPRPQCRVPRCWAMSSCGRSGPTSTRRSAS